MKRKRILQSALAIMCATSLVIGSFGGQLRTVVATDTDVTELTPPEFPEITFSDFGIEDDSYTYVGTNIAAATGSYEDGLLNKTFVGEMNFSAEKRTAIIFGGQESLWSGFALGTWVDERLWRWDQLDPNSYKQLATSEVSGVIGQSQVVKISFEVFAQETDGVDNDIRIWLYFGDKLYNNAPLMVLQDYTTKFGNYLRIYPSYEASSVTVASVEPPQESLPIAFTQITPKEFGVPYAIYEGVDTSYVEEPNHSIPVTSMNEVRFDTKLTMGKSAQFIYMQSNNNDWEGMNFILRSDGTIWLQNNILGSDNQIWMDGTGTNKFYLQPAIAIEGATNFEDEPFLLTITTEYVAADVDQEDNDIKMGVWFNYKLYNEQYFYIKNCRDSVSASIHLVRYSGSITLDSPTPLKPIDTYESYNLSDGNYLVTGTGTITVNGEVKANGTTLTEPGEYTIISDNGRITRHVTLYRTGSTSTALTYEDGVMPIIGYHGPYNGTDSRGEKYNLITEESYELLHDAGFNLISKIDMNWADAKDRIGIIKSLEYAEKYGMGLYVWDYGLKELSTDEDIAKQIANYSQYDSFKGIYVVDEPATDSYNSEVGTKLDTYVSQAKAINNYCNLNAYINLFPDLGVEGDDFSAYVDEYLTKTDGRYISYDYYAFGKTYRPKYGDYLSSNIADYFKNLSAVREKAMKENIPFWPFVQVGNHWNTGSNEDGMTTNNVSPTREQLLWNVNTSLAYGAKGIQYFPMVQPGYFAYATDEAYDYERNGVIGANGEPTQWYPYIKEANEQIANVDEYLLEATSKAILAKGTAAQTDTAITADSYGMLESITVEDAVNGAVVGAFDFQGNDMFYVVNYDMADTTNSDKITLNFKETLGYCFIQDEITTFGEGTICELTIPAGEAVLVILDNSTYSENSMIRVTPKDFGLEYQTYPKAEEDNVEGGQTNRTCAELTSMDNVIFKTGIKLESGANMFYMKDPDNHWQGVKFRASGEHLYLDNTLTEAKYYAGEELRNAYGFEFNPAIALNDAKATSLIGVPFYLTLTTEFVGYDTEEENDLKLGIYFNDKLYNGMYFYILDCKDNCSPNLFLYRTAGALELANAVVFGSELQPEITDSIAMTYRTILTNVVTEAPTMSFVRNGKEETITGTQVGAKVWEFTYPNVLPQNMAQTITATLQIGEYTKIYQTSMLEYSAYVLKMEAGTTYTEEQLSSLKELIVDLVQYGATVQRYNDYSLSVDSDALLTNKLELLIPDYVAKYDLEDETSLDGVSAVNPILTQDCATKTQEYLWKSASLVLGNKISIRCKFAADSVEKLTIKAKIRNKYYTLTPQQEEDHVWFVDFDAIYAYAYDEPIRVSFYVNGEQVGKTVNYSVNTYLHAMRSYAEVDESLWGQLLLAIYNYGTAAAQYQSVK